MLFVAALCPVSVAGSLAPALREALAVAGRTTACRSSC